MPLPTDPQLLAVSGDIVAQFDTVFGYHPGFRPAHARGITLTGTFTPSSSAHTISTAPHFNTQPSTPITVRFSSATGIPQIPDTDPNANPRGIAVRFHLGERKHTDIIGQSTPAFPVRTGAEFVEFFRAIAATTPGAPSPTPIEAFVGSHPAALAFVQFPKPPLSSFARAVYYSLNAMEFTNGDGSTRFGRYVITAEDGVEHLNEADLSSKSPNYLFDEITERLTASGSITFKLDVQLANEGDVVDDVTVQWPADRPVVNLGTITVNALVADNEREQKHLIFDPIPRVEGIEPSDDPILEVRAAVYLISGRRRREA